MTDIGKASVLDDWLSHSPIVPVITLESVDQAVPLAKALFAGGLSVLEVTLRTPAGLPGIEAIRATLPDVIVGAGTVMTVEQLQAVQTAGAQFVVSPGSTPELLSAMIHSELPILPGIATLSELMLGYQMGLRRFKFFPAEISGGIKALKAFSGPAADCSFCPTGGVSPANLKEYLALANVVAVGGTWLTPADALASQSWSTITELAKSACAIASSIRTG